MHLAMDVHYESTASSGAVIGFEDWSDSSPEVEAVIHVEDAPAAYRPGYFFQRELPLLLKLWSAAQDLQDVDAIVIDGYTWLDDQERPGLGAHLYRALDGSVPVVGVAKTLFQGSNAVRVMRGASTKPLYVSTAGIDACEAADLISTMHGRNRTPTLLKHVDRLARGIVEPDAEKQLTR